jgi:AcrR family transcriptional regulator
MSDTLVEGCQVRRTRAAVLTAFRKLFLTRRYVEIRVADIVEGANVGRSTFYDHFAGKEDVLMVSMAPLLEPLADAAAGRGDYARVLAVLKHFREQTARARAIFSSAVYFKLVDRLATMIALGLLGAPDKEEAQAFAVEKSAAQFGLLRAWINGQLPLSADQLAVKLIAAGDRPYAFASK